MALLLTVPAHGGCLTPVGGGNGYLLVKTTFSTSISIALPDCSKDHTVDMAGLQFTFLGFIAGPAVPIWPGAGDPNAPTPNGISVGANAISADPLGLEWPYSFTSHSLKDIGTHTYQMDGSYWAYDGQGNSYLEQMASDEQDFIVGNTPASANPSVNGTLHVGNTITLESSASDIDGGSPMHFQWTVTGQPPSSNAVVANPTAAAPTMNLSDKHDIGHWTLNVEIADAQGELKTFPLAFDVVNQLPKVSINGATDINALDPIQLVAGPPTDADGENVTFVWDIVEAPPTSTHQPQSGFVTGDTVDFVTGPKDIGTWKFHVTGTDEHDGKGTADVTVTVKAIPPKITMSPSSPQKIKFGAGPVHFETTTLDDAYGDPLVSFAWTVEQAPIGSVPGLGPFGSNAAITIQSPPAGTYKFKLVVTDQVNQTAEAEAQVLVDSDPVATITGPDTSGNLVTTVTLDGTTSTDDDSPNTPPDYHHLHGADGVSLPTIQSYRWSILQVPPDLYGTYFEGPVADNFSGVSDTGPTLVFQQGKLPPGDWVFELEVTDAEGNHATADHAITIINEGVPPTAIVSGPQSFITDAQGNLLASVTVDGSNSFDLDNLLNSSYAPGLGITNYDWQIAFGPAACLNAPPGVSGANANIATFFTAGQNVPAACQGTYGLTLTVTDDDQPTPHTNWAFTTFTIGNCAGDLCIDYPTTADPQFVKFSDQTDVMILYHLNSLLYDLPALQNGVRVQLLVRHESDPTVTFDGTYDVDMLPSNKGSVLAIHWSGYDNLSHRPAPGRYTITLQLLDSTGSPIGTSATETDSVDIQTLDISVANTTDAWLNANGLTDASDALHIDFAVAGALPNQQEFDEIRYRIYPKGSNAQLFEDSYFGPFNGSTGSFSWDGDLGANTYIDPGAYELELELLDAGSSLGTSPRYGFQVYKTAIALAGIPASDTLDPGAFLKEKDTIDATITLTGDLASLPGDATLKTADEPGTLTAKDGPNPVDVDAGVSLAASSLSAPKVYQVTAAAPGASGKTTLSFSYQPPGAPASKKSTASAGITVIRAQLRAVSSDSTKQDSDGVFVAGSTAPVVITPANFTQLKFHMRPVNVNVQPDVAGSTVDLVLDSGSAANIELYDATSGALLTLPKSWTPADFSAHQLTVSLLAYGKTFGEVMLHLTYKKGATVYGEEKLKLRVSPQPGMTGMATGAEFPFFRAVRTANAGSPVVTGIDPMLHRERTGRRADVYVVAHKTQAQWALDPTLTDVTGASHPITITAPSVANNIATLGVPPPQPDSAGYDVVYDFGNFADDPAAFAGDGKLDPGDIIDSSLVGEPSVTVEPSYTGVGPVAFTSAEYSFPSAIPITAGYDGLVSPFNFQIRGKLVYPSAFGPGVTAPLVVIAHGNHVPLTVTVVGVPKTVSADITNDENYRGHTYLQEHLASRGYVTMSVDLDDAYGQATLGFADIDSSASSGIRIRGWIILKSIEKVLTDATVAGGALAGKVDPNRIYLIGHSRGGEAVVLANHLLAVSADRPGAGALAGFAAAGVKGIISISPTTADIEGSPTDTKPAVPYLLIYGSADGDVNGAVAGVEPFRHYDRAQKDKFAVRIEGANHNAFNTSWSYSDASETITGNILTGTKGPLVPPVGAGLAAGSDQRDVAKAYVAAFLGLAEGTDPAARAYFVEPAAQLRPLGVNAALPLHGQARQEAPTVVKAVVDDYETNTPDVTTSSSSQPVTTTIVPPAIIESLLSDPGVQTPLPPGLPDETEPFNRFFQETNGVLFGWSAANEYVESLDAAQQDLRGASTISFRIAQQPKDPFTVALGGPMTITVELEDATAQKSAVRTICLDGIPAIYPAQVDFGLGLRETTSAAFQTFRFPIAAFATDGRAIDMGHVTKIRFKLGQPGDSPQGRVAIDDVEVER